MLDGQRKPATQWVMTPPRRQSLRSWRRFEFYAPNDLWQINFLAGQARRRLGGVDHRPIRQACPLRDRPHGSTQVRPRRGRGGRWRPPSGSSICRRDPPSANSRRARVLSAHIQEFCAHHGPARTVEQLQQPCAVFRWQYNHERLHPRRGRRTQTEAHWVLPKVGAGDELPGRRKSGPQILRLSTAGSVNCHTNKPAADWSTPLGRSPSGRPSRIVGPWSVRSSLC